MSVRGRNIAGTGCRGSERVTCFPPVSESKIGRGTRLPNCLVSIC